MTFENSKKKRRAYSLAFLGSMLNGGPGGPRDLGKISTHICILPWSRKNLTLYRCFNCSAFYMYTLILNQMSEEAGLVTCSMPGWMGLNRGRVSTCSLTVGRVCRTCRARRSSAGPALGSAGLLGSESNQPIHMQNTDSVQHSTASSHTSYIQIRCYTIIIHFSLDLIKGTSNHNSPSSERL